MTPRDMARMMRRVNTSSDRTHLTFAGESAGQKDSAGATDTTDVNSIAQRISAQHDDTTIAIIRAFADDDLTESDKSGQSDESRDADSSHDSHSSSEQDSQQNLRGLRSPLDDDGNGDSDDAVDANGDADDERGEEPTPADMPKRREHQLSPLTFAALNSHELPVVREYSAGGLIFNEDGEVAIIARHSRSGHLEWCLPKGHIEKGETPEETAVREVHEETGIKGTVTGSIATIDYWFTGENQRVHKLVHHFVLRQTSGYLTVAGDPNHEAEDAAWVPFHQLADVLSYPNERRIVHLYARKYRRRS